MKQLIRRQSKVADSSQYEQLRGREATRSMSVPEGHVPMFVGEGMERFAVRVELLGHPIFLELLQRSAQEYGYDQQGVLRIPCPVVLFERILEYVPNSGSRAVEAEILRLFEDS